MNSGPTGSVIDVFENAIDFGHRASIDPPAHDVGHGRKLIGMSCAPQCDADTRAIEHPAQRQVDDALVVIHLGEAIELFDRGDVLAKARHLEFRIVAAQIVSGEAVSAFIRPESSPRHSDP